MMFFGHVTKGEKILTSAESLGYKTLWPGYRFTPRTLVYVCDPYVYPSEVFNEDGVPVSHGRLVQIIATYPDRKKKQLKFLVSHDLEQLPVYCKMDKDIRFWGLMKMIYKKWGISTTILNDGGRSFSLLENGIALYGAPVGKEVSFNYLKSLF